MDSAPLTRCSSSTVDHRPYGDAVERAETVIYVDRDGNVLPSRDGAVGGEIVEVREDGTVEHTLFTLGPATTAPTATAPA